MTIPELKDFATSLLDAAVSELRDTGEVGQMFYLLKLDGGKEVIAVAGDISNDARAKTAFAQILKTRLAQGDVAAVVMVSDTFFSKMSADAAKIAGFFRMNVEQACAAGLCEKREALMATLESPLLSWYIRQEYRRTDAGIELVGDRAVLTDEEGKGRALGGRLSGLFQRGAEGRA